MADHVNPFQASGNSPRRRWRGAGASLAALAPGIDRAYRSLEVLSS